MKVALVNAVNREKNVVMNKDLAGGYGGASEFGTSITSKLMTLAKRRSVRIPVLTLASVQGILKQRGDEVEFFEGTLPSTPFDLILIYGSIPDYNNENRVAKQLKEMDPSAKVGIMGPFPSHKPELFDSADFVLNGEADSFFLYQFTDLEQLAGTVQVDRPATLDDLPTPCFDGFPIHTYSYFPAIRRTPLLTLQASRGCPYACGYYCPYPAAQGSQYRIRSAGNLIRDIETLVHRHKVKGLQFRDPIFGINKQQVRELCRLLIEKDIDVEWGIETRLDLWNMEEIDMMFNAGLRNINTGVETSAVGVAQANRRKLGPSNHQEEIVLYCKKKGIAISAFYIFGMTEDTEETIAETTEYALKLNTNVAQFQISIPYPGTGYYEELRAEGRLVMDGDFEKYDGNRLTFYHENLTGEQVVRARERAFRRYYFRPSYMWNLVKRRLS